MPRLRNKAMSSRTSGSGGFIKEVPGPSGVFGVFEDEGDTGYLYLYEPGGREVFLHLHIYDRTPSCTVQESDVDVRWSSDLRLCTVFIWGQPKGTLEFT